MLKSEAELSRLAFESARVGSWNGSAKPSKKLTNAYLVVNDGKTLLLGLKKRGFGEGKVNGFGGKVDEDRESIREAAIREMREESGVVLEDMFLTAVLLYDYPLKQSTMEVYVYKATKYSGEIAESEEMSPRWVEASDLNFAEMWADDPFWMDKLLRSEKRQFVGWFDFSDDMSRVVRCKVDDVPS